uniref:Putative secreted protein n=1 Tax=Anopheles darlingi TaxID=43151 RepID=A0A2M4DLU7_ANODA
MHRIALFSLLSNTARFLFLFFFLSNFPQSFPVPACYSSLIYLVTRVPPSVCLSGSSTGAFRFINLINLSFFSY